MSAKKETKKKMLFLPRSQTATRMFAFLKVFVLLLYLSYFFFLILWTWYTVSLYKKKILEDPDSHFANLNKTHRHFFLFTGLFTGSSILIGMWSILKENMNLSFGYLFMLACGLIFEIVGAVRSKDEEVQKLKILSVSPEFILVLFAILFDVMIWNAEKQLSSLPIYRQAVVESRDTSTVDLHVASSGDVQPVPDGVGKDNPGLIMSDESHQANSTNKSRAEGRNEGSIQEKFL